jgi:uncharacterized protein YbaA (DUF1428 family)
MSVSVDGFVVPVPKDRLADHRRKARTVATLRIKCGALEDHECAADDVKTGTRTSFPRVVTLRPGELAVFSWLVFQSRRRRDVVNRTVLANPLLAELTPQGALRRQTHGMGGFKAIVRL